MSVIKKFFEKKKLNTKFKLAGAGHRLNEEPSVRPTSGTSRPVARQPQASSANRAGEAALTRLQGQSQQNKKPASSNAAWKRQTSEGGTTAIDVNQLRNQVKNELGINNDHSPSVIPSCKESVKKESKILAVDNVLFVCPVCPASLPKSEIYDHIEQCLEAELEAEPLMISITMIHTLNRDRSKVDSCIHTLGKYLQNIIDHEGEEKYRKIRKTNKVFKDKVSSVKGLEAFLINGCGFCLQKLPFETEGKTTDHDFYVMDETHADNIEQISVAKQMLIEAEPLSVVLDRNIKVFEPTHCSMDQFDVPASFYTISTAEIKQNQLERRREIEEAKQLRTKAMRELDSAVKRTYHYTVLRIRFPDGVLLQGTFSCQETIKDVKTFVAENLCLEWIPYSLLDSIGKPFSDESTSLLSLKLAPAAVLNFNIDSTVASEIAAVSIDGTIRYLKDEIMVLIQSLDARPV